MNVRNKKTFLGTQRGTFMEAQTEVSIFPSVHIPETFIQSLNFRVRKDLTSQLAQFINQKEYLQHASEAATQPMLKGFQ